MQIKLVGVLGFEPRTSSLSGTRSNQLSYTPDIPLKMALPSLTELGSPFGNRHFLGAPLSVIPCAFGVLMTASKVLLRFNNTPPAPGPVKTGGADGDRTRNL